MERVEKFDNILVQLHNTLDVFEETGSRVGFIALLDQLDTLKDELVEEEKTAHRRNI